MRTVDQLMAVIPHSSFVKIDGHMYRVDGHILEVEEKVVYLLDEDDGDQIMFDLDDEESLDEIKTAEFYKLELMK